MARRRQSEGGFATDGHSWTTNGSPLANNVAIVGHSLSAEHPPCGETPLATSGPPLHYCLGSYGLTLDRCYSDNNMPNIALVGIYCFFMMEIEPV